MFAGKSPIAKICKIHFQTHQVVYSNYDKSYHDLLNFSNDVSIYQRHWRFLAIEFFKLLMNINPEFMREFFNKNPVQCNLRKQENKFISHLPTPCYGNIFLVFHGSLFWNSLPSNVKQRHNLEEFKLKLRN